MLGIVSRLGSFPACDISFDCTKRYPLLHLCCLGSFPAWDRFPLGIVSRLGSFPAEITEKKDDYEQFGKCLKLGVHEELLRYQTSKPGDEFISLKEYDDFIDLEFNLEQIRCLGSFPAWNSFCIKIISILKANT